MRENILDYEWELGEEKMRLQVGSYMQNRRLYIRMLLEDQECWESFADLTVNIPYAPAEFNEAYIDHNCSKDKIRFIKQHKLGRVLKETVSSGFCTFKKVAFDMNRLMELDPQGVEAYLNAV